MLGMLGVAIQIRQSQAGESLRGAAADQEVYSYLRAELNTHSVKTRERDEVRRKKLGNRGGEG